MGVAFAAGAVLATSASGAVERLRIDFSPHVFAIGTHVTLNVRSTQPGGTVHLTATTPAHAARPFPLRRVDRSTWRARVVLDRAGVWNFRATRGSQWALLTITVRPARTNGIFGPLGAPECKPPSPRNQLTGGLLHDEVLGTATRGRLWGLFASLPAASSWASDDEAAIQGLVGTEMKIAFKFDRFPATFFAVAPDGTRRPPVSGPQRHRSSSWHRSGVEWAASFAFDQAGCWRIHASADGRAGDIWLEVLS